MIILKGPLMQLALGLIKGDPGWELPVKLLVVGFVRAFDFAIEFFDAWRDEFVPNALGLQ